MIISNKRKLRMVLCLALMQFSAYGMTKEQAIGLSLVAGAIPAAFVGHHADDPKVIAAALALPAVLVYQCAKRYTPGYILGQVRSIVEGPVSKDVFAARDPKHPSSELMLSELEDDAFRKKINSCQSYQENIKQEYYPLIIARNKLSDYQESLSKANDLLVYINALAYRDESFKLLWNDFDDKKLKYSNNIVQAIGRIVELPEYPAINQAYVESQNTKEQLKINRTNADANMKNAQNGEKAIKVEQQKADAQSSYVLFKWFRLFFGRLFGYKTE